jgi:hypothetical protein
MTTFNEIMDAIEKLDGIDKAYIHPLEEYIVSSSINKKDIFSATIKLDGKSLFKDPKNGLHSEFRLIPLLLFIKNKEI